MKAVLHHITLCVLATLVACTGSTSNEPEPEPEAEVEPEQEPDVPECDGHDGGDGTCLPVGECIDGYTLLPSGRCGGWTRVGTLATPSRLTTVTATTSGALLALGRAENVFEESIITGDLYRFDSATGSLERMTSVATPRVWANTAHIGDDRVLLAGGEIDGGLATAAAEIVNVREDTITDAAPMPQARGLSASFVHDGRVLMLAGFPWGESNWAYDIADDSWALLPDPNEENQYANFVQMDDGRVAIVGGWESKDGTSTASVNIYDPETMTWETAEEMLFARHFHAAATDGAGLFVAGGAFISPDATTYPTEVEYSPDPTTDPFVQLPPLPGNVGRIRIAAHSLGMSEFLVVGGGGELDVEGNYEERPELGTSYVYNVDTGEVVVVDSLNYRTSLFVSHGQLADGSVLVVGGYGLGVQSQFAESGVDRFAFGVD